MPREPKTSQLFDMDDRDQRVIDLARTLVRVPSITPVDSQDYAAAQLSLDVIEQAVQGTDAYAKRLAFSGDHDKWDYEVDNLYLEWSFGDVDAGDTQHICYIGHTDVVPPGDAEGWTRDPFSGEIEDGYLYGRGTTDMKGSVASFVDAVRELSQEAATKGLNFKVSMILTTDEEWAAVNGTKKVLDWMAENGKSPDAFIVGEPSSQDVLGSHIKIGRRGSLCGTFSVKGVQGHAAYSDLFENPNRPLALAMAIVNTLEWRDGNAYFPNTNFEPVAIDSGNFRQTAVIPGKAEALWNIRYTHKETPESLDQKIKDILKNPPEWAKTHPDFEALKNVTVKSNIDTASLPYYSDPAKIADASSKAIEDVLGEAPIIDGSGGTTDGRFVHGVFPDAEIIELGLPERGGLCRHRADMPKDYLERGGMHQKDERALLSDIVQLRDIFKATLTRYAAPKSKQSAKAPKP